MKFIITTLLILTSCTTTQRINHGAPCHIAISSTLPGLRIGQYEPMTRGIKLLRMAPPHVTAEIIGVWSHELVHALEAQEPQAAMALRNTLRRYEGGAVQFNLWQHNEWRDE